MYIVPGLEFQESYLRYLERLYPAMVIHRIPYAPQLADWFRCNKFRHPTAARNITRVAFRSVDAYIRKITGVYWIADGERACESVQRNAMIRHCNGIDSNRGRVFPLAYWSERDVMAYLRQRHIALAPEYGVMGLRHSFASLFATQLVAIKTHYPQDFERICKMFPLVRAQVMREEKQKIKNEKQSVTQ